MLATFPIYYWAFAAYAFDYESLINEVIVGFGFLIIAYLAYKLNSFMGVMLLVVGYIAHAVYDVMHNSLFYNEGTPLWWPEFCGTVDLLIALYLVYLATVMKQR